MATGGAAESDKDIGLTVVLGALAVGGAVLSLATAGTLTAALGFGAAVLFGSLLVVALHVYD